MSKLASALEASRTTRVHTIDLVVAARELRRAIAVITQESFLFSGTVASNLRYGRVDATGEKGGTYKLAGKKLA